MDSKFYINNNEETKTYDIMRRVSNFHDELICSVHSVEYISQILKGLSIDPDTIDNYHDNTHMNNRS